MKDVRARKIIGVIGASQCSTDFYELARQVGDEIAFGLNYRKPVIGLRLEFSIAGIIPAKTLQEAVSLAFKQTG